MKTKRIQENELKILFLLVARELSNHAVSLRSFDAKDCMNQRFLRLKLRTLQFLPSKRLQFELVLV